METMQAAIARVQHAIVGYLVRRRPALKWVRYGWGRRGGCGARARRTVNRYLDREAERWWLRWSLRSQAAAEVTAVRRVPGAASNVMRVEEDTEEWYAVGGGGFVPRGALSGRQGSCPVDRGSTGDRGLRPCAEGGRVPPWPLPPGLGVRLRLGPAGPHRHPPGLVAAQVGRRVGERLDTGWCLRPQVAVFDCTGAGLLAVERAASALSDAARVGEETEGWTATVGGGFVASSALSWQRASGMRPDVNRGSTGDRGLRPSAEGGRALPGPLPTGLGVRLRLGPAGPLFPPPGLIACAGYGSGRRARRAPAVGAHRAGETRTPP